jgi:hypothetical protein
MSVTLHQIMSTDEQACPRCQASDGVTMPMVLMPETDGDAERRVSPSPGRGTA